MAWRALWRMIGRAATHPVMPTRKGRRSSIHEPVQHAARIFRQHSKRKGPTADRKGRMEKQRPRQPPLVPNFVGDRNAKRDDVQHDDYLTKKEADPRCHVK